MKFDILPWVFLIFLVGGAVQLGKVAMVAYEVYVEPHFTERRLTERQLIDYPPLPRRKPDYSGE